LEHTINDDSQWLKTVKKRDSKLQKQQPGWPKISNMTKKIQQRWKSGDFKCRREHILCHDWLIKITWSKSKSQQRREFRVRKFKTSSVQIFSCLLIILLISNHTVFLVHFGIYLPLWVIQRAEIALPEAARAISAFWITHSCKLILNWTRNRMIT